MCKIDMIVSKLDRYQEALEQIANLESATQIRSDWDNMLVPENLIDEEGWAPINPIMHRGMRFAAQIARRALSEADEEGRDER